MNVNPTASVGRTGERSRGLLIPLLAGKDLTEIGPALEAGEAEGCAPFRLVAAGGPVGRGLALSWTQDGVGGIEPGEHALPVCWATSGLGDSLVAPRLSLFGTIVATNPCPAAQDDFHRHSWPGRGAESVLMSRADARTVSLTTVESRESGVEMVYAEIGAETAVGVPGGVGRPFLVWL